MDSIYSATYSNVSFLLSKVARPLGKANIVLVSLFWMLIPIQVPVYEFKIDGDSIMRRRSDDWVNATHVLKAAGFDKPARTRILEREVQKGNHEKVQGGYGKYQGAL
jgi:hypothetical protein